jgi:uncharacterized protein YkwD
MAFRVGLIPGIAALALSIAWAMAAAQIPSKVPSRVEHGILEGLNQLRENPAAYAEVLKQERRWYQGRLLQIPNQTGIVTNEGMRALDEAIAALESVRRNIGRVVLSEGLSNAAADQVRDAGRRGLTGHKGADGSEFDRRIDRYGQWSGEIAENIAYGPEKPRDVIIQQLVDDGVGDRGHRKNLLNPAWRYVGIACGPHARYGTMCVMDFAVSYRDF